MFSALHALICTSISELVLTGTMCLWPPTLWAWDSTSTSDTINLVQHCNCDVFCFACANLHVNLGTCAHRYDVLVATDAVGMGLNLNIRRVLFTDFTKPSLINGKIANTELKDTELKQIAGRAGRRGSRYVCGFVAPGSFVCVFVCVSVCE